MAYPGTLVPGNYDTSNLPMVPNGDKISTVHSKSFNFDGKEVILPTVFDNALHSDDEAIQRYRKTGQHLGIYDGVANANVAAQKIHEAEARRIGMPDPTTFATPAPTPSFGGAPASMVTSSPGFADIARKTAEATFAQQEAENRAKVAEAQSIAQGQADVSKALTMQALFAAQNQMFESARFAFDRLDPKYAGYTQQRQAAGQAQTMGAMSEAILAGAKARGAARTSQAISDAHAYQFSPALKTAAVDALTGKYVLELGGKFAFEDLSNKNTLGQQTHAGEVTRQNITWGANEGAREDYLKTMNKQYDPELAIKKQNADTNTAELPIKKTSADASMITAKTGAKGGGASEAGRRADEKRLAEIQDDIAKIDTENGMFTVDPKDPNKRIPATSVPTGQYKEDPRKPINRAGNASRKIQLQGEAAAIRARLHPENNTVAARPAAYGAAPIASQGTPFLPSTPWMLAPAATPIATPGATGAMPKPGQSDQAHQAFVARAVAAGRPKEEAEAAWAARQGR